MTATTTATTPSDEIQAKREHFGNFATRPIEDNEYRLVIDTIRNGFEYTQKHKPNEAVAMALLLESNLGLRVSDIVRLKLSDIVRTGARFHLDITEQKTHKKRTFTVPADIYYKLADYANANGIQPDERLIPVTTRQVQKLLKEATEYLGISGVGTHSFRKRYASSMYEQNDHDIRLVQSLLQHSSPQTTLRYLVVSEERIEQALASHNDWV